MSTVDWVILAFTVILALYGYAQGLIVGVLSLGGFALGAYLGTRLGPLVLAGGKHSAYAPLFGLLGALLAGGILASGLEGVGARLRRLVFIPGFKLLDGLLGAGLTACIALGIAWIIGAVVLESDQDPALRMNFQHSTILRALDRILPPSGPILQALAHFDPLPSVSGPQAAVAPPVRGILGAPGVRAARASVVRIQGTACGLGVEGSGWVAAPDTVITNAHVIAGEAATTVQPFGRGPGLPALVIGFDPREDIAVLHVAGLHLPVLRRGAAPAGRAGAIAGYPLDGPFNLQPARLGTTEPVQTQDAYGNGPVTRSITSLRGLVRPGNSGGPVIDAAGGVIGTVFAAVNNPQEAAPGGFAIPNATVSRQLRLALARTRTVSSGGCAG